VLGAGAVLLAPDLGDLQLEVRGHRLGSTLPSMGIGELGLGLLGPLGRTRQKRLERFDIVRTGQNGSFHAAMESQKFARLSASCAAREENDGPTCALRTPGILRITPVDPVEQAGQWRVVAW